MKPGKPVILAIADSKPLIGIPGYPVSAFLAYRNFVAPVLAMFSSRQNPGFPVIEAVIAKRLVSSLKHREYVRVKVGNVDGRLIASPLARGAGAAMSLVRADGFCVIAQNSEGIEAGEKASVELFRPLCELDRTLVSIGSHDLIVDIIADMMSGGGFSLAGTHVGSMAGLMALKRGECHLAPIHLLDEETGTYNIPYLKRLFPETPLTLIKGLGRVQGLIVQKGNPLGLRSVADLPGCRFINRQHGAGTRLFLDFKLKEAGIAPNSIQGYDREAVTHMAVAAAVQSGSADVGMGIASAAAALGLDFITLGNEEYDFALYTRFLDLPQLRLFLETLKSVCFHKRLGELGGYTWDRCGELIEGL
jgi:putative molybdopterin biosynthesis protein